MPEKLATVICKYCYNSVYVPQKNRKNKYCSDTCKVASKATKHLLILSKRKPKGTYKFSEDGFAINNSIDKSKYSKIFCNWCKKYYYVYTTVSQRYTNYCSKQCQELKIQVDLQNKPEPERNIYNKDIYNCSYEQFKYLSFLLSKAKHRAKDYKREFNITLFDLIDLLTKQNQCCALTGVELSFKSDAADRFTASLDRINSNFGYVKTNIQLIGHVVNTMKSNLTQEEFLNIAKLLINKQNT